MTPSSSSIPNLRHLSRIPTLYLIESSIPCQIGRPWTNLTNSSRAPTCSPKNSPRFKPNISIPASIRTFHLAHEVGNVIVLAILLQPPLTIRCQNHYAMHQRKVGSVNILENAMRFNHSGSMPESLAKTSRLLYDQDFLHWLTTLNTFLFCRKRLRRHNTTPDPKSPWQLTEGGQYISRARHEIENHCLFP